MRKLGFSLTFLVGAIIIALIVLPWIWSHGDPTGPIGLSIGYEIVWFFFCVWIFMGNSTSYRAGNAPQLPDYMVLQQYSAQMSMRRNLDQIAQSAQRQEMQSQIDRMNK